MYTKIPSMNCIAVIVFFIAALCLAEAQLPRPPICGVNASSLNPNPWIVYLEHHILPEYASESKYVTKGFLISNNTVVTSASNVDLSPYYKLRTVHFGEYAHMSENRTAINYENDRNVVNITKHGVADLALVKFDPPVTFSDTVRAICLPDYIQDISNNQFYNFMCSKYTYVKNQETHPSGHATRTTNSIRRWKKQDCDAYYHVLGGLLHSWQDCYSEIRSNTCSGEFGGPLMYNDYGYVFAAGLASNPITVYDVPSNSPSIYVNFMEDQSKLLNWIKDNALAKHAGEK